MQKNEVEMRKVRRSKKIACWDPRRPFILAIILFAAFCIEIKIGFDKYRIPAIDPLTWDEFFKTGLPYAFILGVISFFVIYAWQLVFKHPVFYGRDAAICLKCNKVKMDDHVYNCECGGKFVPLDELDWEPDEKDASKNP